MSVGKSERESVRQNGPIERHVTLVTLHNVTYISGRESVTLRTERGIGTLSLPQNRQKVVEPPPWGVHPFYPDVDLAPPFLELRPQQLGNRMPKIERPTIPEVQARPHAAHLTPDRRRE